MVQGLSDQDRVMLASYRGGKQFMFPDGKTKINSADYDMNVRVNTQLTYDKANLSLVLETFGRMVVRQPPQD